MQRGPPSVKFTNTVQPSDPQLIQVFVFTDLVVITSVCRSRYEASEEWTLSENVGIVKVLGVTELSHETGAVSISISAALCSLELYRFVATLGPGCRSAPHEKLR
jgi:hypothetical protein